MALILSRALNQAPPDDMDSYISFKDKIKIDRSLYTEVSIVVKNKLIQGDGGLFRPADTSTRAEASAVVYRLYKLLGNG
jgi:hypothetical protein